MKYVSLAEEVRGNTYPGRGIVLGRSEDGKKAVIAYFIMGRSENSRNRVFVNRKAVSALRHLILQNWTIHPSSFMLQSSSRQTDCCNKR